MTDLMRENFETSVFSKSQSFFVFQEYGGCPENENLFIHNK